MAPPPLPTRGRPKVAAEPKRGPRASFVALAQFLADQRRTTGRPKDWNPFKLPTYAPGVLPNGVDQMAMDDNLAIPSTNAYEWASTSGWTGATGYAEGLWFMGYPYLAELSQRSEYRIPGEVLAEEMTRKWITIKADTNDEDIGDEVSDKVKQLTDAVDRFKLRDVFRHAMELDSTFGLSFIYIDLMKSENRPVYDDENELKTKLMVDQAKVRKGSLRGFKVVDPMWSAALDYDSRNPLDPTFYNPQVWSVMAQRIHHTRLLRFTSRPVPDLLKPAYNFGGISLMQMMKPYIDNWLTTRQSINDLIQAFTTWNLKTNMSAILEGGSGADMDMRLQLFSLMKSNRGVMATDMETEDLQNISAPLGTLDHLQAQAQEHMAAVARIPLVKLFGITPSGLNASSDGEIRTFYDSIHAAQEKVFQTPLQTALDLIQLNEFGTIDPAIKFTFNPLWELDEAGEATVRKTDSDNDVALINGGIISPEEARARLAKNPKSGYEGLKGPPPEPPDMGMGMPGEEGPPGGGGGEGGEVPHSGFKAPPNKDPFSGTNGVADSGFEESDHPRDNDGKFSSSGGGHSASKAQVALIENLTSSVLSGDPVKGKAAREQITKAVTGKSIRGYKKAVGQEGGEATTAYMRYDTPIFQELNQTLRDGKTPADGAHFSTMNGLDAAIKNAKLSQPLTLFRGAVLPSAYIDDLSKKIGKGGTSIDKGFLSTSLDENVAGDFTHAGMEFAEGEDNVPTKFTILTGAGNNGLFTQPFDDEAEEAEVILPRDSRFIVKSVDRSKDGGATVVLIHLSS